MKTEQLNYCEQGQHFVLERVRRGGSGLRFSEEEIRTLAEQWQLPEALPALFALARETDPEEEEEGGLSEEAEMFRINGRFLLLTDALFHEMLLFDLESENPETGTRPYFYDEENEALDQVLLRLHRCLGHGDSAEPASL